MTMTDDQRRDAATVTHTLATLGFFFTYGQGSVLTGDGATVQLPVWQLQAQPEGGRSPIQIDMYVETAVSHRLVARCLRPGIILSEGQARAILELNGKLMVARVGVNSGGVVVWADSNFEVITTPQLAVIAVTELVGSISAGVIELEKILQPIQ
jgi:hypothetical protein